ncbi:MAG: M24 family metallopeptidase [Gammaproteobacteria bacterium]|jgi:Xaa-Pro dipeptidase|nr:M24 family metallopeptidase [Gammaproteobacteria bacterium]
MRRRDDMTFPIEEHERRLEALRQRLAARRLDAAIISDPENLFYLTEHQTTGYSYFQCLVVPLEDEPFMITRAMEASNVRARTWVEDHWSYPDTGDAIQTLYRALCGRGLDRCRVGYERNSYFFPAYQQDRIRTALADGELVDCYGIVEEGRLCKSDLEIEVMQRAAAATEAGMRAGFDAVAPGVTENEIAGAICQAMFAAGGEYPAVLPYVTSGPRTLIGHATWEGREVQPGEHVYLEVGGCFRRYHTAMMRTVLTGERAAAMAEAEAVMAGALDEVHRVLKPGTTVSDVDKLVRDLVLDNRSGAYLATRAGYSIGIAFAPAWDEGYMLSLKQGESTYLKPGMTLHVIPWMWNIEGDKAAGMSDTVRITDDGCASFFSLERRFAQAA